MRILAQGVITAKVQLTVSGASQSAIEAIEKAGGSVTTTVEKKVVERKGGRKVRAKDKKPAEASGNDS